MKKLLLAAIVLFSLASCKKDNPTKTELLTNKDWKLTAATVDPGLNVGGTVITDYYAQMSACEKDNLLRFSAPNLVVVDEGATMCNTGDPQTQSGTWSFNSTETILTIAFGSTVANCTVVKLEENTLAYSISELYNGINYTLTRTFTKQ